MLGVRRFFLLLLRPTDGYPALSSHDPRIFILPDDASDSCVPRRLSHADRQTPHVMQGSESRRQEILFRSQIRLRAVSCRSHDRGVFLSSIKSSSSRFHLPGDGESEDERHDQHSKDMITDCQDRSSGRKTISASVCDLTENVPASRPLVFFFSLPRHEA